MKSLFYNLLFIFLFQTLSAGHYTSGETRISLNGLWQFRTDPQQKGGDQKWFSAKYDDKHWNQTEVPGSWESENETTNYIVKAWYRTTFQSPAATGKRVYLEFEAVRMSYRVFLNDKLVARELVGNYCEKYDVTDQLQAKNTLAVEVDNSLSWGVVDNYRNKKRCYEQMKDFYAPVRALEVKNTENGLKVTTSISITPRSIIDIPAFTLTEYKLIWEVKGKDGSTNQGSFINLPAIKPGDKTLNFNTSWAKSDNVSHLKISILSPTSYNVKDTTIFIAKPVAPKVKAVIHACRSVRVVFEKNEFCTEYALKYTVKGETKTTASTIDHYIDLKSLPINVPVQILVAGINGAGEGEASVPVTIVPENGYNTLPPIIWAYVPTADGCNMGIDWVFSDTFYEVRYTTSPPDEESWKIIPSITFGAFKVKNLNPGEKYFVQVRNATQFGANRSEWSETIEVTPGSPALRGEVKINGIIKSGKETILSISPSKYASSYTLSYETGGKKERRNYQSFGAGLLCVEKHRRKEY